MRIENRDKSTPRGRRVASAKRIATDMQPSRMDNSLSNCFLNMHRQINSAITQCLESRFREITVKYLVLV